MAVLLFAGVVCDCLCLLRRISIPRLRLTEYSTSPSVRGGQRGLYLCMPGKGVRSFFDLRFDPLCSGGFSSC